jgi:hypothetical protein
VGPEDGSWIWGASAAGAKFMKLFFFITLALTPIIHFAAADVQIGHSYYMGSDFANEIVYLQNTDYVNNAELSLTQAVETSSATPRDHEAGSKISGEISINEGAAGTSLNIDSKDFACSSLLGIGDADVAKYSYGLESGKVESGYQTADSFMMQGVALDNNAFQGSVTAIPGSAQLTGTGYVLDGNQPGSFTQIMVLNQRGGHSCMIKSQLETPTNSDGNVHISVPVELVDQISRDLMDYIPTAIRDKLPDHVDITIPGIPKNIPGWFGNEPVSYAWNIESSSIPHSAELNLNIKAKDGNVPMQFTVVGSDDAIPSGKAAATYLQPTTGYYRDSEELYMNYALLS